jgi:hypothetical protein
MTQEFDLLKSLNIEVSAAPTPSRGSFATPSVDWDARSHSSLASSVVSLSIDKLSGAVVDRMVAHAREASPRHSLEFFKGPSHSLGKQHNPSSIADGASSDAWSVSGPASAAPSIVSHWSNKCRVPPPTLKHSHASSRAQSVVDREEPRARGSDTIVLQLSSGLRASEQLPSSAAATATNSAPSSVPASVVAQAAYTSHAPVSEPAASDSGSAAPRHSVSSHTPAQSFTSARPYTAHGVSPLSILVGCGERQPNVSARRVQQQKYAQDLAQQIQTRSSISAPAARKSEPVPASTSLHFHPSESSQPLAYPRERCPFQISKQVRAPEVPHSRMPFRCRRGF